jgi:hypothetical protein
MRWHARKVSWRLPKLSGYVITFHKADKHPATLQEVRLRIFDSAIEPVPLEQVQSYVAGKVFWLGFRSGGRKTRGLGT